MQEKLIVPYPVIVEGKYDKIKLSSIIEAQIIPTAGFGVFKNRELSQLLRKLSQKSMIIVLTDSDGGGKVIRSHISSLIPKDRLIQLYTPQIKGKERRKEKAGKEGLLGVEGMSEELLADILKTVTEVKAENRENEPKITKAMLFEDGLSGGEESAVKRRKLEKLLGLPPRLSANALIDVLNRAVGFEEYKKALKEI